MEYIVHQKIESKNFEEAKRFINNNNVNINSINCGFSLLSRACGVGSVDMVTFLLSKPGIKVNRQSNEIASPLQQAVYNSDEVTELLLSLEDIDINDYDTSGMPSVEAACVNGRSNALRMLLALKNERNLDTTFTDIKGNTISYTVCLYGHIKIAKILMEHALFDASSTNHAGFMAINVACFEGHINFVRFVLDNVEKTFQNRRAWKSIKSSGLKNLLCAAIEGKQSEMVNMLLKWLLKYTDVSKHTANLIYYLWMAVTENEVLSVIYIFDILKFHISPCFVKEISTIIYITCKSYHKKSIIKICYELWEKLTIMYAALIYLYWMFTEIVQFDKERCLVTVRYFLYKRWRDIFAAAVEQSNEEQMLYFAILNGLQRQVEVILEFCQVPINLKGMIKAKRISFLNLSAQHPDIYRCIARHISKHQNESIDENMSNPFTAWYTRVSRLSTSIGKKPQTKPIKDKALIARVRYLQKQIKHNIGSNKRMIVYKVVLEVMDKIAAEVKKLNELFQFAPILVGSGKENTRPFMPDEFDFLLNCIGIIRCLDISYSPRQITAAKLGLFNAPALPSELITSDSSLNVELFKEQMDILIEKAINITFQKGVYNDVLVIEKAVLQQKQISCIHFVWRDDTFKDMPLKIDLVPSFEMESFQPGVSFCPNSKYYVFCKGSALDGIVKYPIAFSEEENELICSLPKAGKMGFMMAKGMRSAMLFPDSVIHKLNGIFDLEDYLKTYLLKQSLFYCKLYLQEIRPDMIGDLVPFQWTYLIYKHIECRLNAGTFPNIFMFNNKTAFACLLLCYENELNVDESEERGCCTRRKNLLTITRWILRLLMLVCVEEGVPVEHLNSIADKISTTDDHLMCFKSIS